MENYVDGFVFPIPMDCLEAYQSLAEAVAEIWKEHGALDYQEFVGDDLALAGTQAFTGLLGSADDECVIFGWVAFESRKARDLANQKVASDPRVAELMAASNTGFDASRMAYGGFRRLV
ncbi:MAG: DUF1428 family protein [Pseudomonadota bacterium]